MMIHANAAPPPDLQKILIIQTAFIGDVILSTVLIEKLRQHYPQARIDFLLRKGNESLLQGHPQLTHCWVWDKKRSRSKEVYRLVKALRAEKYDLVVNAQRYATTGLFTTLSGAKYTIGFDKNPLSRFFSTRVSYRYDARIHEVQRILDLVTPLTDGAFLRPKLYPTADDFALIAPYIERKPYICIAPTSVWYTKQFPAQKWIDFLDVLPEQYQVYLIGAPEDHEQCALIAQQSQHSNIHNLAGKLPLLASSALMAQATMNYVNDSAPLHLASATNAPTCAIFCSTTPDFGYGPLSDNATIVQVEELLECRPCGTHGHKQCPLGHFACALSISSMKLMEVLPTE
jgi:heptosyltransferase-2